MASNLQTVLQDPHLTHSLVSMTWRSFFPPAIAFSGHTFTHSVQPLQLFDDIGQPCLNLLLLASLEHQQAITNVTGDLHKLSLW